ncbi:unnamed protein product [Prunus armeniaca]
MYDEHKLKLKKDLRETKVCLTTDTWTSVQNYNYMMSTAHFIDCEWKMHKRVLNFCVISNHQGPTIGKLIENCLLEWGIEKVLAITVDNVSANKVTINWVRSKLNRRAKAEPILQGKYLHVRYLAHITNLIVVSAFKYKKAFVRMGEDKDNLFLAYFKEPEHEVDDDGVVISNTKHIKVGLPSEDDWENATVFVNNRKEIDKLFVSPEMATSSEAEKVLVDMASKMREKYNKYFVKFEDMNVLLVIAIVLDPRFKLRHMTHLFKKEKFDDAEVEKKNHKDKSGVDVYTVNANSQDVDDIMDDWIKGDDISTNLEDEPTPKEYEFYESVGLEYASTKAPVTNTTH